MWLSRASKFFFLGKELFNLACPRVQESHLVTKSLAKVRKQWTVRAACPKNKLEFKLFLSPDKRPKMKVVEQRTLAWYSKTRCAYDNQGWEFKWKLLLLFCCTIFLKWTLRLLNTTHGYQEAITRSERATPLCPCYGVLTDQLIFRSIFPPILNIK